MHCLSETCSQATAMLLSPLAAVLSGNKCALKLDQSVVHLHSQDNLPVLGAFPTTS